MSKSLNQRAAEMMGCQYDQRYDSFLAPIGGTTVRQIDPKTSLDDAAIVERWVIQKYSAREYLDSLADVTDNGGSTDKEVCAMVTASAAERVRAAVELHERMSKEPKP